MNKNAEITDKDWVQKIKIDYTDYAQNLKYKRPYKGPN